MLKDLDIIKIICIFVSKLKKTNKMGRIIVIGLVTIVMVCIMLFVSKLNNEETKEITSEESNV